MDRIGQELLQESKAQLMTSGRKVDTWRSKDLLSLLVRSNMNTDISYRQRMSDEDVLARMCSPSTATYSLDVFLPLRGPDFRLCRS